MLARLAARVALEAHASGEIVASFGGYALGLGRFGAGVGARLPALRAGLPLAAFASARRAVDSEVGLLVRRLASHGLLEFCVAGARGEEMAVVEPQCADYWPRIPRLDDADAVVLSRFAYLRRRGSDIVLESPRAGALFRICTPGLAAILAALATPQTIGRLRRQRGFPGLDLLALLVDSHILFKAAAGDAGLRAAEGDRDLVLWDFHDLLFHARSTAGRHANPLGATYPHAGAGGVPPPPVRPRWPGNAVELSEGAAAAAADGAALAARLRQRRSTRSFDDERPITLAELGRFLDATARVVAPPREASAPDDGGEAARPYPSAGAGYELELYLAVDRCAGLARGFYHYDAAAHALAPIAVDEDQFAALLSQARLAMGAPGAPQVLITIAARFGRIAWKYSSIAYALVLKDVGVLMQTLYLMAADMGLGGCAIGIVDIELFAKMTGMAFHVEGPVGQFALGRGARPRPAG